MVYHGKSTRYDQYNPLLLLFNIPLHRENHMRPCKYGNHVVNFKVNVGKHSIAWHRRHCLGIDGLPHFVKLLCLPEKAPLHRQNHNSDALGE